MSRLSDCPRGVWLTINRDCNLKCSWCYAQNASCNPPMSVDNAKKAITIISDLGIQSVSLIGGEPSIYPHLMEILDACREKQLKVGLITNGLKLSDPIIVNKLIDHGVTGFNISMKSCTSEGYLRDAGVDALDKVLAAIDNLAKSNIKFTVSIVITDDNVDDIYSMICLAYINGAKSFYLSFCNSYSTDNGFGNLLHNPYITIQKFIEIYWKIKDLDIELSIHQNMPLCIWPDDFVKEMKDSGNFESVCQLHRRSGLVFDTDLSLIPCNSLHSCYIGHYGVDYTDAFSLKSFINSESVIKIYKKLLRAPSIKCLNCEQFEYCGGGCVMFWTNNKFDELLSKKTKAYSTTQLL